MNFLKKCSRWKTVLPMPSVAIVKHPEVPVQCRLSERKKRRVITYLTDLVKVASRQVPQIVFDPHLEVCLGKPKFSFKESRPVLSSR